jgi:hypothetical protein
MWISAENQERILVNQGSGSCLDFLQGPQTAQLCISPEVIPALETVAGVAVRRWLISKRSRMVGLRGILSLLARVST